jgi:hypothetical protein
MGPIAILNLFEYEHEYEYEYDRKHEQCGAPKSPTALS